MIKDSRFIRVLMYLYLFTSLGLGALLLCMSYAFVSSQALNSPSMMILVPVDQAYKSK